MKLKYRNYFRPVLYAIFGLSVVFACQKINPFEDVKLIVDADIYKSPMFVEFIDANENATVPKGLAVTISGPDKDLVLNDVGSREFKVIDNVLTLFLDRNVNPTENNPIIFTIAVSGSGYVSTSSTIKVTDPQKPLFISIPVTNVSAPPVGASSKTETLSLVNGQTLTISPTVDKPELAQISILPNTKVKDKDGNEISSTNVKAQVVQYGIGKNEYLNNFPGGLMPETIILKDGTSSLGTFISSGFLAIDMESNGKKVAGFSQPIDLKIGINPDLINPETNLNVREGDKIPTWSLESDTGIWSEEGIALVTKESDGKLVANFKVPHLSYWNMGWAGLLSKTTCNKNLILNVTSNRIDETPLQHNYSSPNISSDFVIYASYAKPNSNNFNPLFYYYRFNPVNGAINEYSLVRVEPGYRMKVEIRTRVTNQLVGTSGVFDFCSNNKVPITINVPDEAPAIYVDFYFSMTCKNKGWLLKPTTFVRFTDPKDKKNNKTVTFMKGGGIGHLRAGIEYDFTTNYDGKSYTGKATFSNTSTKIIATDGTNITAQTNYDAAKKVITVKLSYVIDDCK